MPKLYHRYQPTQTSCGQACAAMVTGKAFPEIRRAFGHMHATYKSEIVKVLEQFGVKVSPPVNYKGEALPPLALIRLSYIKRRGSGVKKVGHYVVYFNGLYYNPCRNSASPISPNLPPRTLIDSYLALTTPEPLESALANPTALPEPVAVIAPINTVTAIPPIIRKAAG
jgi:hypothetical protein